MRTESHPIPFNRPSIEGHELEYVRRAIEGGHGSASGPFSARVSSLLIEAVGSADALLTTSGTAALELAALLLDLRPGDSVIVPSFAFVTTALAFARAGARLVFADIEPETLGIDPDHVAELVDDTTRAVVPVHYAGIACRMPGLLAVLAEHPRVDLVEDNAHGLFGSVGGRPLGSIGRFAALSFHETKNFTCGEGGALIVNRSADVGRAQVLYDKGTSRRAFLQGVIDCYSWIDTGSSFGLSDLLAAYLLGQLEAKERVREKRRALFDHYQARLAPASPTFGYRTPHVPPDCVQSYHMFYLLMPDRATRDLVLGHLDARGFKATFHYVPLHDSIGARPHLHRQTSCPVTDAVSGRLLRLPFFSGLSHRDADRVVECLFDALDGRR